jgi:mannosyltransferase
VTETEARADALALVGRRSGIRRITIGVGLALALGGIALSPTALLHTLLPDGRDSSSTLALGARLFTYMLMVLGAYIGAAAWWLPPRVAAAERGRRSEGPFVAVILVGTIGLAAALRVYSLDTGLWYDEILMHVQESSKSYGEIFTTYDSKNQHFLYTLLARLAMDCFGDTAWALRLPAALFGVLGVAALYAFAREVADASEALLATALLAFSYHHVWFSQNARGYSGVLFWALLSSALLLRALGDGRQRWWALYAVTVALGVYTHMTMVFVMAGHALVYLSTMWTRRAQPWPARWDGGLLGFPLAGLLILQLHAIVLPQVLTGVANESSVVTTWRNPAWAMIEIFQGLQIGFSGRVVGLVALAVCTVGLVSFVRTAPTVATLLIVPVVLCAAIVIGSGHHVWPRFFFFASGFAVLIVVRGAMVVGRWIGTGLGLAPARAVRAATVASLLLVAGAAVALPRAYAPKQDFEGALKFVEASRASGDSVVTVGLATMPYQRFYKANWGSVESVESLEEVRSRAPRTWLVYTLPLHLDAVYPDLMVRIRNEFQVVRIFPGTLSGGAVIVCRSEGIPRNARAGGV